MPELPDITIYLEALEKRILGRQLKKVQIGSPFLLRTAAVPVNAIEGHSVVALIRLGKRIAIGLEDDFWLVLHLMIAGRLHWREGSANVSGKLYLATFQFSNGQLLVTEAGTKKRASLHLVHGFAGLRAE